MMKLIKRYIQPRVAGIPAHPIEFWDLGGGLKIRIFLYENVCSLGVEYQGQSITDEIARHLGLELAKDYASYIRKAEGKELFLSIGIDCVVLNYTKPENYKDLFKRIESIVNEHIRRK